MTFTIDPARRSIIDGNSAMVMYTAPKKFTAITRSMSSTVVSAAGLRMLIPALFTTMSTCPNRSIAAVAAASASAREDTS